MLFGVGVALEVATRFRHERAAADGAAGAKAELLSQGHGHAFSLHARCIIVTI